MAKLFVDQLLTNFAKGWRPSGHINGMVLPTMQVMKQSGKIAVYGADNLRLVTSIKSPEGETPTVTMRPTLADAYVLEKHAIKAFASNEEAENADSPIDVQRDKAELVTDLLSLGREIALAQYLASTSNIAQNTTLSGTSQFGGAADDPIAVIDTAVQTVADSMGCDDSEVSLIVPLAVRRKLVRLTEILDTLGFKYHQSTQVTNEQLAAALGVKQVLTPAGIYNSAADGQTDAISRIWGKSMWAVKIAEAKVKSQGFGFTPTRKAGPVVDKWFDNDRDGWWVRNTDEFDQYIVSPTAAYLIKDAVA